MQNATMGMSCIANGIDLNPGDEIVTTDQEHSGGIGGWRLWAARTGIVVTELPLDDALDGGPEAVIEIFRRLSIYAIWHRQRSHCEWAFGRARFHRPNRFAAYRALGTYAEQTVARWT